MIEACHAEYVYELHTPFPILSCYPAAYPVVGMYFQLEWKTENSVDPRQMAPSEAS